jgi:glycosyltransferase involved in cell wall biosynthesis
VPDKRIVIFGWAHSVHIRRWVSGLTERGWHIKVISLDGAPIPGIETVVLPRRNRLSYFTQAARAAKEAQAFNPQLLHVHYASGFGWWGLRASVRPTVVSVWGSDVFRFPSNFVKRYLLRRILRGATRITATSQMLRDLTLRIAPDVSDRVSIIPFGVRVPDGVRPMPSPEPLRICYIKPHKPIYGPDVLIRAITEVKKAYPGVIVNMAGQGPITARLEQLIHQLHLEDNVKLVGFIDPAVIGDFVAEHHLMVMPSLMESFGVAVLDASAGGRPVIASNVGGVPEVLQDGKTGLLVPPGDHKLLAEAIIRLGRDSDLMARMGRAGHEFVKVNYSWNKSLDMMTELYERLIYESKSS